MTRFRFTYQLIYSLQYLKIKSITGWPYSRNCYKCGLVIWPFSKLITKMRDVVCDSNRWLRKANHCFTVVSMKTAFYDQLRCSESQIVCMLLKDDQNWAGIPIKCANKFSKWLVIDADSTNLVIFWPKFRKSFGFICAAKPWIWIFFFFWWKPLLVKFQ